MREIHVFLGTIDRVKEFVNTVSRWDCDVDIAAGRYVIDAKSIMGIFSIDLSKPVCVRIHAEGEEAENAVQAIRGFVVK